MSRLMRELEVVIPVRGKYLTIRRSSISNSSAAHAPRITSGLSYGLCVIRRMNGFGWSNEVGQRETLLEIARLWTQVEL